MEDCHLSQLLFGIIGEDNLVSCSINLKCQPQEGDKVSTSQPHRKCAIKELQIPFLLYGETWAMSEAGRQAEQVCKGERSGGLYCGS